MVMRILRLTFTMIAMLAVAAAWGAASSGRSAKDGTGGVSGDAVVKVGGSGAPEKDASRVVVWLVPQDAAQPVRIATARPHYRLVQRNKRFEPGLLVVPVGSVVDFPNADPWFHNVFSLYRGKRFDLGLYQAGAQRSVRFDRMGPSYLFCNIHPEMTGVVLAVDSELFAVTDKSGRYAIAGVAPGKYVLHVWYENATPESLRAMQRQVTIESADQILASVAVKAVKPAPAEHKNKYGQDYDPDTLKTDY
jgi:plastocyanin